MIKRKKLHVVLSLFVAAILLMLGSGCKKDEEPARETSYNLKVQDVLGVTGIATFIETSPTASTITLQLFGSPSGSHPAALYMNTAAEGGTIVVELNPVNGSGSSSTVVETLTIMS